MEHTDPLWWIQPKIEETEEECEAQLRRISEDLKAYYHAKKYPAPRRVSTPMDELLAMEEYLTSELLRMLMIKPMPVQVMDSLYFKVPEKKREPMPQMIIINDTQPEIPPKKREFYEYLQHPKNPKRGR